MLFDQGFLASVDDNPVGAIVEACDMALRKLREFDEVEEVTRQEQDIVVETVGLIDAIMDAYELTSHYSIPEPNGPLDDNYNELRNFVSNIHAEFQGAATEIRIEGLKRQFQAAMKSSFAYEFSQGDLERIQTLVNELRDSIGQCEKLDPTHKQRLLKRLEHLQSELHKRVSDLDRFWGLIGDAGVVLGKLGEDAKPIVDRIREIAQIVWRTQARTEELPSSTPIPKVEHEDKGI